MFIHSAHISQERYLSQVCHLVSKKDNLCMFAGERDGRSGRSLDSEEFIRALRGDRGSGPEPPSTRSGQQTRCRHVRSRSILQITCCTDNSTVSQETGVRCHSQVSSPLVFLFVAQQSRALHHSVTTVLHFLFMWN